jgi:hypothetical protein
MKNINAVPKSVTKCTFNCYERLPLLYEFSQKSKKTGRRIIKLVNTEKKNQSILSFDVGQATQKLVIWASALRRKTKITPKISLNSHKLHL